jgi:(1->4)-alpha-D-glucan 1-alpha-D-glucosylmutase
MIARSYRDFWGEEHAVPESTIASLEALLERGGAAPGMLEPVAVVRESGARLVAVIAAEESARSWTLSIANENNTKESAQVCFAEGEVLEAFERDGRAYERRAIALPFALEPGYHDLTLEGHAQRLIVAPGSAYVPPEIEAGRRTWGIAVQLYGLRSERNWGIGDFTDLANFVEGAAAQGAGAIGLNPLHLLHSDAPAACSPYSPSSRYFRNALYLDIEAIEEFATSARARELCRRPGFIARLRKLRGAELIDFAAVSAVKRAVLDVLFEEFEANHVPGGKPVTERGEAFAAFVRAGGERLRNTATFEALAEDVRRRHRRAVGLEKWPEAYRRPDAPEVAEFARRNEARIAYFSYLQWQIDLQLSAVAAKCGQMPIGLYVDLAVGVDRNSADAWGDPELVVDAAKIGAPPDAFTPHGQDWGLAPLNPAVLRERAYEPFSALLRANMRHAGALRIDHVMGLMRQFWIPDRRQAVEGAYVQYPFEDLLGILALESRRNRCIVIGEDLGVVPEGFRERMERERILSYRLMYFEREWEGRFRRPENYPALALASPGTHDLPTLRGYWEGRDITFRGSVGFVTDAEAHAKERDERLRDRALLLDLLVDLGLLAAEVRRALLATADPQIAALLLDEVVRGVYRMLARTPSVLMMVAAEDLAGELDQPNFPGTMGQHPNWRRRLHPSLAALLAAPGVRALLATLDRPPSV